MGLAAGLYPARYASSMTPTLVIVPGLGDSGPGHWQSLWEHKFGAARVRQDDPDRPTPAAWADRLQQVIEATPGEVLLVGHSTGVLTIVHWAARAGGHARVRGALLVGPTDAEDASVQAEYPALTAMAPVPTQSLPFPALVVASESDPFVSPERAQAFADAWGAEFVSAGDVGHINTASGHGDWPDGEVLLSEAMYAWAPPEIDRF